jgi:hypothetical protein
MYTHERKEELVLSFGILRAINIIIRNEAEKEDCA